jgi:hypothetical protein
MLNQIQECKLIITFYFYFVFVSFRVVFVHRFVSFSSHLTLSFFLSSRPLRPRPRHLLYSTLPYYSNIIIGTSIAQSGGVYDPADIQIVNRPNGATTMDEIEFGVQAGQQFAGRAQPEFVPPRDPGFFFDGRCTSSSGDGISGITAHTCTLNLCLGGCGNNCLALYCGSAFVFDPFKQPTNTFQNSPQIPPSYLCSIIGGTNIFQGAKGSVDVTTLTGRTTPLPFNSGGNDSLSQLQKDPLTGASSTGTQFGFITQRLNLISNVPLPPAP